MFDEYQQGWREIYEKAKDDLEFYIGKDNCQWNETALRSRTELGRPSLTVNVLPQFVHQVTNQIRQNTPSINVIPSDVKSSEETAKILKGLIRKIEYNSGADEVFDTASMYAVTSSLGFIRVNHDYVSPDSFLQHILIERVQNPLSCWIDPTSVECDGGDAKGAIIIDSITKRDFEKKYGKDKAFTSFEDKIGREVSNIKEAESINIAEIFVLDYETVEKQQNEDGSITDVEESNGFLGVFSKKNKPAKTRKLRKPVVKRYLFSGADKLEESIFPCKYIPIIPVYGQEIWVDGKRNLISLIRNAKDPQRRYNHWASIEAEILDKSPMAPWLAEAGVVEEFPDDYTDPDSATVLRYRSKDLEGNPASPPQRVQMAGVPSGIINAMQGAYEDIKRAMGLYDASVGQKSNETSGIAIEARQQQGDVATFHFPDNLARSVTQVGRVIISMIPQIYDTAQIIQIVDDEENTKFVGVNGAATDGQDMLYMLTEGQYDVVVTTGRSYASRTQEGSAKLGEIISADPAMMGVFGDLWAKGLDIPFAEQLAERIKKTIDPKLLVEQQKGEAAPDPEKEMMMQQMQQMDAQIQQMLPIVEGKQQEAQLKQAEMQMKGMEAQMNQEAKQADYAFKQQEMQMKYELESKKLANEETKLQMEAEKLQMERDKMQMERDKAVMDILGSQLNEGEDMDDPIEVLQTKLQEKLAKKEAVEMEAQAQAQKEADNAMKEAQEAQDRQMLMQVLTSIAQGINELTSKVGQTITAYRPDGSVIGTSAPTIN